jgi:fucokinase
VHLLDDWNYLIVTAANEGQAEHYRRQIQERVELGCILGFAHILVIPDPGGRRIGSGGSTVLCLAEVLRREGGAVPIGTCTSQAAESILSGLRILIIHSGGDSRRLPGYSACGKLFVPLPLPLDASLQPTLFDEQVSIYRRLPRLAGDAGQVVIVSGDVLTLFDPSDLPPVCSGLTGFAALAAPEEAAQHGVFCAGQDGRVRRFLQKPTVEEQRHRDALDGDGHALLDTGIFSFDAAFAARLLGIWARWQGGVRGQSGDAVQRLLTSGGMNFYREICCATGSETTFREYLAAVRGAGSRCDEKDLQRIFESVSSTQAWVIPLAQCDFLHFGTSSQLVESGRALSHAGRQQETGDSVFAVNCSFHAQGGLHGHDCWAEGCRVGAAVEMRGRNLLVGADILHPLVLSRAECVHLVPVVSHDGDREWCVCCYHIDDTFKLEHTGSPVYCGMPLQQWLEHAEARPNDIWPEVTSEYARDLWSARLFPAVTIPSAFSEVLWMLKPRTGTQQQKANWRNARRYSFADILAAADLVSFMAQRADILRDRLLTHLPLLTEPSSSFSAADLSRLLVGHSDWPTVMARILEHAHRHAFSAGDRPGANGFAVARVLHSAGTALDTLAKREEGPVPAPGELVAVLRPAVRDWLEGLGARIDPCETCPNLGAGLRSAAMRVVGMAIIGSGALPVGPPRNSLRPDEIVWGRAPVRLDLGGGWSDTPPYSLENGGCVLNAAVNLNGQPPIQAYARIVPDARIRIRSIDLGDGVEISSFSELDDFRDPSSNFGLAKAAFVMAGFTPRAFGLEASADFRQMLNAFGGGIELTTFAAVPKGSGLGTSSIMGAVIMAVIQRVLGNLPTRAELFHSVLRLEQALSTGGGWQDQIGGVVEGVKKITAAPGLIPQADIHQIPPDVLDPKTNAGQTLLYYTGITRLAKNILQKVVGRYLDRERAGIRILGQIRGIPNACADAMSRKDYRRFGELVDASWRLNQQLDPGSTNAEIERLLAAIRPHLLGAKLLGAGGGGFLLLVCKSPSHATAVREMLTSQPPNNRARFFDYSISMEGLVVTVS